jgi:hypothetical protein
MSLRTNLKRGDLMQHSAENSHRGGSVLDDLEPGEYIVKDKVLYKIRDDESRAAAEEAADKFTAALERLRASI